ncbi:recombinase family protein [Pantoea dispersa]|uniref:recombinase family protein n=1 Tax=Pantoea dispersa TaxID=59814 RepID=UPI00187CA0C6|nr:recombinase family protein [Pantoea dispersa]
MPYWLKVNAARDGFDVLEERAEIIRSVFRMRLEGMSFVRISCALNAQGKENLKGKVAQWNSSSIERLIRKKAVIGYLVPSQQCTAAEAQEIPGYYPPIMSEEDFALAQLMYREPESRRDGNFNPYLINIFRGLMRCGLCGHAVILTGISVKGYGYYVCSMRRQNRCEAATIRRDLTDRYLISGLVKEASVTGGRVSAEDTLRPLTARHLQLTGSLHNVIRAIEIAPDVSELSERAKCLSGEIRRLEKEMTSVRQMKDYTAATALNLLDISDRRTCQRTARSLIREIRMHTGAKTCDVFLNNGMKIHNYPLSRQVGWSSILDAMAFLGEEEIFL